ncbi:MAG: sigma-70 family RNA polymerase sigma factor [Deltaproteobacteria bacterium]|nr:sigma-70 family RNA polymerase sigma factor [Deltaproteobacteria bacterium]
MIPSNRRTQDTGESGQDSVKPDNPESVTVLLGRLRQGDRGAMEQLLPLVYEELRRVARRRRGARPANATLNTTAVVHEAFLKMAGSSSQQWQDRVHFFAVAAQAMRYVLTDYSRRKTAEKRGGERQQVDLDDRQIPVEDRQALWILDLDRALDKLRELSPRLAQVVECRYYGGMTDEEVAEVAGVTARTVRRDWEKARAWLYRELER